MSIGTLETLSAALTELDLITMHHWDETARQTLDCYKALTATI